MLAIGGNTWRASRNGIGGPRALNLPRHPAQANSTAIVPNRMEYKMARRQRERSRRRISP